MTLDSLEYKQLVIDFGDGVSEVADDLYAATTEDDLTPENRAAVIAAGERKLRQYDELLRKVPGARNQEVQKRFGDVVEEIRTFLDQLRSA